MTRGEHQQIQTADALLAGARARAAEQSQPAARTITVSIPVPSARAVRTAAGWTLGIVLFICALPFIWLGLFEWGTFVADVFYERHTPDHVALSFAVTFGTWFGAKALVIVWLWRRDRRNGVLQTEIAAPAERNPLSGLLRENATHWHVALAVVRFGIVAALIIESFVFHAAHYWDHSKDLLTAWTPCLLVVIAAAFTFDWSWAIIKAFPVAIVRALRAWGQARRSAAEAQIAAVMVERPGATLH